MTDSQITLLERRLEHRERQFFLLLESAGEEQKLLERIADLRQALENCAGAATGWCKPMPPEQALQTIAKISQDALAS